MSVYVLYYFNVILCSEFKVYKTRLNMNHVIGYFLRTAFPCKNAWIDWFFFLYFLLPYFGNGCWCAKMHVSCCSNVFRKHSEQFNLTTVGKYILIGWWPPKIDAIVKQCVETINTLEYWDVVKNYFNRVVTLTMKII